MRAIFYLLMLVSLSTITYADVFPQAFRTSIGLNIDGCSVSVDTEDNSADFTTNISSAICNITNTSTFSYSKSTDILFVRNVSCGESSLENLTKTCIANFGQVDYIGNFTSCKEGKARLEENYDSLHEKWESADSTVTNKTTELTDCNGKLLTCQTDLAKRGQELDQCYQEKSKETIEKERVGGQRFSIAIIFFIGGIIAKTLWDRKPRNPRDSFPQQTRTETLIAPDVVTSVEAAIDANKRN